MNPYVSFGLAMCLVVVLALAGTGYMAVYFNRKSKQDIRQGLEPLAELIDGELDLDEATVSGKYQGHLAQGKIAMLPGGMGRVFQSQIIDGAGGSKWSATVSRPKDGVGSSVVAWEPPDAAQQTEMDESLSQLIKDETLADLWFRVEYDAEAGHLRLTRPMRTRRDLPPIGAFQDWLDQLVKLADANRHAIETSGDSGS